LRITPKKLMSFNEKHYFPKIIQSVIELKFDDHIKCIRVLMLRFPY